MKGIKLLVFVLMAIALGMIGLMFLASNGTLPSWSKGDATSLRWMLGIILGSIVGIFTVFAFRYENQSAALLKQWKVPHLKVKKPFLTWKKTDILYRHAFMYCAVFFLGVLIFGLGGGFFMKVAHYVFTLLAAVTTFLIVVRSEFGIKRVLNAIWLYIAALVWLLGFFDLVFTVYFGEFLFAIRVMFWVESKIDMLQEND